MATDKGPIDLLDYLWRQWRDADSDEVKETKAQIASILRSASDYASEEILRAFVEHSRKVLRENRPVGLDYLSGDTALRFQDAMSLPIVAAAEGDTPVMQQTGFVPLTRPSPGKGAIAPSRSWGVTGEKL